jgi:hypothetical protein
VKLLTPSPRVLARLTVLAVLLGLPSGALAHGGGGTEVKQLSLQPARVLAQQALAELVVRNDVKVAAVRLDAALKSKDKGDIDVARLRQATETLDAGRPKAAIPLLDEALSRPLGSDRGKALHEAGREFHPATGTPEIIAIALGALLTLIGGAALWRTRSSKGDPRASQEPRAARG